MAAGCATTTERVDVTTMPAAVETVSRTENVPLLLKRCEVRRSADVVESPKSHAYVQVSRQLAPSSVVGVASKVTRSERPGVPGDQLNDGTGTLGPFSAITTERDPEVTVLRLATGVSVIVAEDTLVFAEGDVKRTVAAPLESVVTSGALKVPVVEFKTKRCPATARSW